jgi:hypothetical protein
MASASWKRFALTAIPTGAGAAIVGALIGYSAVGYAVLGLACGVSAGASEWFRHSRRQQG